MQVSIRELKANPARAIAAIRPGAPVQITSRSCRHSPCVCPSRWCFHPRPTVKPWVTWWLNCRGQIDPVLRHVGLDEAVCAGV